ncbi:MAG: exonuclease SbcCD subunit D [Promethearchaeota archaeon]
MRSANIFKTKLDNTMKIQKDKDKSISFIHSSDIHFGCQQYRNYYRSNDFIRAFQEILSLAILHKVDFILLVGDVFTSLDILPEKLNKIVKILQNFKIDTNDSIPIIAIEGNHDLRKYTGGKSVNNGQSWLKFISNLGLIILLDADLTLSPDKMFPLYNFKIHNGGKIRIKNVMIYGSRFFGDRDGTYLKKIQAGIEKNEGFFNILLQHFGIEGQMQNVPGMKLQEVELLKDRVNYLALGHYHKQFILNDWIYNPGSSEAACSIDYSYKRGVFLVEILEKGSYKKKIQNIRLNNRKHLWITLNLPKQFKDQQNLTRFMVRQLKQQLKHLTSDLEPINPQMPILYLRLEGKKPLKSCKINEKKLIHIICNKFPVVDVKIYQKFRNNLITLDNFF